MAFTESQKTIIAFLCLIGCNLIFGLSSVVYKVGLKGTAPIVLSFYRQLFATPILFGVSAGIDRSMPQKMDTGWFILIGMFGVFLNQTMYTFAVYYAGAALASILQLTNTPTTAGVAILVGLEKFTWYKGAGLFGAVFGALIMVVAGKPTDAAANRTLGIVISLVQAWFIAAWVVIAKKYLYVKYSPTIVASWMHVTGLPWIIMVALSTYGFSGPGGWETFKLDSTGIWAVAFACLFHSVVAYLCVNYANSHLDASICATFGTLNPLFGTVSSVLILGESVSAADIIGGLMILAGLACVVYQRFLDSKKAKAALEPPEAIPAVIPTSEDPSTHNSDLDKMQVELDDISDDSDH